MICAGVGTPAQGQGRRQETCEGRTQGEKGLTAGGGGSREERRSKRGYDRGPESQAGAKPLGSPQEPTGPAGSRRASQGLHKQA